MAFYLWNAKGKVYTGPNCEGCRQLHKFLKKHGKTFPLVNEFIQRGIIDHHLRKFAMECRSAAKIANAHASMDLLNIAWVTGRSTGYVMLSQDG